ncbi:GmrSD restriction endonuclease domain-containing protein [Halpernia frigidisoli]|uniref:Uncharacterized conserved protein, contains ParB-like and HNH nuclease domains n=1 Tax=Halpernia frigidisoli TaxID=1125876 RepID=A0A1I3CUJ4_9FLAO|nr:DUF262 domain-containing protein [Halpernia frigidisoli]SFH77911.1 Uncharacterized conserved protein, contains ParB-like and HNH nuclease domains [Halpernia frigidisoli]
MQINHSDLKSLNIKDLLLNDDKYIIPVYQRNYEWKKEQIEQLLIDIKDYFIEENDKNYYIGTLIVDKKKTKNNVYETIDGQQRLTTINILCCAMKELNIDIHQYFKEPIISFESRKNSDETIDYIFNNGGKEEPKFLKYNVGIFDGIVISKDLLLKLKNELSEKFDQFIIYFFKRVFILRAQVPEDTDMNHYFEIMNSRGEQLEKHEILKARLMKELNTGDNPMQLRQHFNFIWEACSDMITNVQLHFQKEYRNNIFGENWFDFVIKDSEELFNTSIYAIKNNGKAPSLGAEFKTIIKATDINLVLNEMFDSQSVNESEGEQFQPIINFENFLLHVLKIQEQSYDVSLDDKRLLSFFENILNQKEDKVKFVKDLTYTLLQTRFLLDQYIVSRKYTNSSDSWSLQCLKFYSKDDTREKDSYSYVNTFTDQNNGKLIMLLSMFHVSTPTQIYKYWLFAALNYLVQNLSIETFDEGEKSTQIQGDDFITFLENIAQKFMLYRHLANSVEDYNKIILSPHLLEDIKPFNFENKVSYGNIESNLVFNYLDYILWNENQTEYKDFEFSFRSSVEHYYPQNPITGEFLTKELIKDVNILKLKDKNVSFDFLNCLGNLCLITHNNNSRLSNHMPKAKKDYYVQAKSKDSIKQLFMMNDQKYPNWKADEIFEHHNEMISKLSNTLFMEEDELAFS